MQVEGVRSSCDFMSASCSRGRVSNSSGKKEKKGLVEGSSSTEASIASVRKEKGSLSDQCSSSISRLIPGCISKSSSSSASYASLSGSVNSSNSPTKTTLTKVVTTSSSVKL